MCTDAHVCQSAPPPEHNATAHHHYLKLTAPMSTEQFLKIRDYFGSAWVGLSRIRGGGGIGFFFKVFLISQSPLVLIHFF